MRTGASYLTAGIVLEDAPDPGPPVAGLPPPPALPGSSRVAGDDHERDRVPMGDRPRASGDHAGCNAGSVAQSWAQREKVEEYVERVGRLAPRQMGEVELLDSLPKDIRILLDLGCGDARLACLVGDAHPEIERIVAVDNSQPMLELARTATGKDARATVRSHDLNDSLRPLGTFDAVISGFAIHHMSDDRKRSLLGEIVEILHPGGVFANLEVVRCATPELHAEFYRRIGRERDDPEDVLAPVEPQLEWMREAGLVDVDCQWRWRGFALLVGRRSGTPPQEPSGLTGPCSQGSP